LKLVLNPSLFLIKKGVKMKRIKELDGIRGIAIFLVLLWHYIAVQATSEITETPFGSLIKFLALTWSGVDLFFVLSGFLIVGILLDTKGSTSYFSTFYIRRILRILPLYALMLALFLILPNYISNKWLFSQTLPIWSYFTFTQNFFMHGNWFGPNWLAITWSLSVEEQFYLVLPLMVWGLSRKKLTYVFLCLILMSPIFRLIFNNLGAYVFPFARADSILMGGLLAMAYRNPQIKDMLVENYNYLIGLFLIFLFGAGVLTLDLPEIGNAFVHMWLAVLYSLFILVCVLRPSKIIDSVVSNRFFIWLGLRSYGIYLFHQPVGGLVHQALIGNVSPRFSNLQEFYMTMIALIMTLLLAEISFRFFESVFLSYGRKFQYETKNSSLVESERGYY